MGYNNNENSDSKENDVELRLIKGAAEILMRTEKFPLPLKHLLGSVSTKHQGELAVITARLQYFIIY